MRLGRVGARETRWALDRAQRKARSDRRACRALGRIVRIAANKRSTGTSSHAANACASCRLAGLAPKDSSRQNKEGEHHERSRQAIVAPRFAHLRAIDGLA